VSGEYGLGEELGGVVFEVVTSYIIIGIEPSCWFCQLSVPKVRSHAFVVDPRVVRPRLPRRVVVEVVWVVTLGQGRRVRGDDVRVVVGMGGERGRRREVKRVRAESILGGFFK